MIDRSAVYRRANDVRYRVLDGEAVVLCQQRGEVIGLSEVGARMLDLCDGARDFEGVLDRLGEEFEVERAALELDVTDFLGQLVEIGVLVRAS